MGACLVRGVLLERGRVPRRPATGGWAGRREQIPADAARVR
jgi:hypothetical protein